MSDQTVSADVHASAHNPAEWGSTDGAPGSAALTQFISFAIGDDHYGVDIMAVREIKGWIDVTHLPKQPDYVRGVINLRGVMVPIIDLRCRFGQGMTEATPLNVIVVVQIETKLVGLLADRVSDIVSFDAAQVQPVPRITQAAQLDFLSGLVTVDGKMIALVSLANLLSSPASESEDRVSTH